MADEPARCGGCFVPCSGSGPCPECGFDPAGPRSPIALPPGTLLGDDHFAIGRVLGRPGGFGVTYLAWDTRLATRVAVKEFLPRHLAGRDSTRLTVVPHDAGQAEVFTEGLREFLAEARRLAQCQHSHVVRARHFFEQHATGYLVMDYHEGETLAEYARRHPGPLDEIEAVDLIRPVLAGLEEVHRRGWVHRDVKPQNIYLAKGPEGFVPLLLDFGAARQLVSSHSRTPILSPGFAPYEQYYARGDQGPWTDVYACAATLYAMVTAATPPDAVERLLHRQPLTPPEQLTPTLSGAFCAALKQGLAVEPKDRPQTIADLLALLAPCGRSAAGRGDPRRHTFEKRPPRAEWHALPPGFTFHDGLEVGRMLGRSEFTATYLGRLFASASPQEVVIKVLPASLPAWRPLDGLRLLPARRRAVSDTAQTAPDTGAGDSEARERWFHGLLRRAESVRSLQHRAVVRVHEVGQFPVEGTTLTYLVTEFVPGTPLDDGLRSDRPLARRPALEVAIDLADALAEAHARRLLHLDVCPGHVLLTGSGQPAKLTAWLPGSWWLFDPAGTLVGRPSPWAAPELWLGLPSDERADLYSLGAVIFAMLTGRVAFAPGGWEALRARMTGHVPEFAASDDAVPPDLRRVITGVLAGDPSQRQPASAAALGAALRDCLSRPAAKRSPPERRQKDVDAARNLVMGVLEGIFTPENRPAVFEDDLLRFGVALLEEQEPERLVALLADPQYASHCKDLVIAVLSPSMRRTLTLVSPEPVVRAPHWEASLTVLDEERRVLQIKAGTLVTVGRAPLADLVLGDHTVARRHCEFLLEQDRLIVRDLGSHCGIFVNGSRAVDGDCALEDGDVVRVGAVDLLVGKRLVP